MDNMTHDQIHAALKEMNKSFEMAVQAGDMGLAQAIYSRMIPLYEKLGIM